MDNQRASRLRQKVQEQIAMLENLAQGAQGRCELLPGSLYERRRRCGRRRCRCARGALHRDSVLSIVGADGRRRVISVPGPEVDKVSSLLLSYRRFRQTRAEMVRVFTGLLETFDELGRLRHIEPGKLLGVPALE